MGSLTIELSRLACNWHTVEGFLTNGKDEEVVASIAFRIARLLTSKSVVWLCDDDQQAEALAACVAALAIAPAVYVPTRDALPGESFPASLANIGQRRAALHALALHNGGTVACILSGEAAAGRYPAPADPRPPIFVSVGDTLDPFVFAEMLSRLGYIMDDRVDEPGEVALRGEVIDLFPAQASEPVRLDMTSGTVASIRVYDPLTQMSADTIEAITIFPAVEPKDDADYCILNHLSPGILGMTAKAEARRLRYIALAKDAASHNGRPVEAVEEGVWKRTRAHWADCPPIRVEAMPRFAERRAPLAACKAFLDPRLTTGKTLVLAGSARDLRFLQGRLERRLELKLSKLTSWADVLSLGGGEAGLIEMPVEAGFIFDHLVVLAAGDLLGSRAGGGAANFSRERALISSELQIGDLVVHEEHGVGRIEGLQPAVDGEEMIAIEYAPTKAGQARRLLSVEDAGRVWRYGADGHAVALDKLDGSSWAHRRALVGKDIIKTARALRKLARQRSCLQAPALVPKPDIYERFVAGFAFNETPDQARAIVAVREDLASGRPMDRLVIGDVGYGKTEVALRAAALAALSGHQVVLAAPTTVLVRQHLESFAARFAGTQIKVAGLSRLTGSAERDSVRAGLADGSIGVVIGTGAVMGPSIRYARLGLVIIDEEQRFGSAEKARLRRDGRTHVLALSATPIPRTLQAALVGLQTVSTIATPPARRRPIRTTLDCADDGRLRTALLREKDQGGQSFVVVPRIEDMGEVRARLERVVPALELLEAHGKMAAGDIDAAMMNFATGRGDILLATNIIEAGLDIPRANTMIVWRADRFGLAQLHQLRGRVGRGARRGQVFLLTDAGRELAGRTQDRLRTLETLDRLGSGFEISARDLDMRGGGDLAGESQSGHMRLIGVDFYQHLLIQALQSDATEIQQRWMPDLRIGRIGCLPEAWIPEANVRLGLYGRLARLRGGAELEQFEEELFDRFGPFPSQAELLFARARIARLALAARVARIDAGPAGIAFTLRPEGHCDPRLAGLTEKDGRWVVSEALGEDKRLERIRTILEVLAERDAQTGHQTRAVG